MSALPTGAPAHVPPGLEAGTEADIDYNALVTEDHKPVDRIFVEKLYRLLTRSLYASWPGPGAGRPFLVLVNVGWFYQRNTPAVVPDCLLSLDVTCPENLQAKEGHSYYQWDMGKQPDVVIEIVSDRTGGEESSKKDLYARLGVAHYAVFDPKHFLSADTLRTYELVGGDYHLAGPGPWPKVGLGLRLWQGKFEGHEDAWVRWCDAHGEVIPTGEERARQADERITALEAELRALKSKPSPGTP
jgi:Uma2 family endonuclease